MASVQQAAPMTHGIAQTTLGPMNVSSACKVGDRVTMPALDTRTRWQKCAPLWLGGREFDPDKPIEVTIVALYSGDA